MLSPRYDTTLIFSATIACRLMRRERVTPAAVTLRCAAQAHARFARHCYTRHDFRYAMRCAC